MFPADPSVDGAAIYMLLVNRDEEFRRWIHPNHLADPSLGMLVAEIKRMKGPLDPIALSRHLSQPGVKEKVCGKFGSTHEYLAEVAEWASRQYASKAHDSYYKEVLNEQRLGKGMEIIARDLAHKLTTGVNPHKAHKWLKAQLARLESVVETEQEAHHGGDEPGHEPSPPHGPGPRDRPRQEAEGRRDLRVGSRNGHHQSEADRPKASV